MKKNYPFVGMVMVAIMVSIFLLTVTAHSQEPTAAEKTALCQKEQQSLDQLNEKLRMLSFQIPMLKGYIRDMTAYYPTFLKLDSGGLDRAMGLCLLMRKPYNEAIERAVDGSIDQLRHKYKLRNLQTRLDYLTEIKTKRLIGETPDPENNAYKKTVQQYKKEIDQLEDAEKYLTNDLTMNKGRMRRLKCDETDLTESQKQERCQNNKNSIAELEKEGRVTSTQLSEAWTEKEIEYARDKMVFVISMIKNKNAPNDAEMKKLLFIAKEYEYQDFEHCMGWEFKKNCLGSLERRVAEKINKAVSLDRQYLIAKQKDIENQIADHRSNLIALRCDEVKKNNNEEYIKKLVGGWTDKPTPWGTPGGACQIKYANGKMTLVNEDKKESGASISINSDGSAVITASNWPVNGYVNIAGNSIKWSNKSEWVR